MDTKKLDGAMCRDCFFFDNRGFDLLAPGTMGQVQWGICRRFPPSPRQDIPKMADLGGDIMDRVGLWPLLPDDLWCGEFQDRDAES